MWCRKYYFTDTRVICVGFFRPRQTFEALSLTHSGGTHDVGSVSPLASAPEQTQQPVLAYVPSVLARSSLGLHL